LEENDNNIKILPYKFKKLYFTCPLYVWEFGASLLPSPSLCTPKLNFYTTVIMAHLRVLPFHNKKGF
jgi:hypothetical protein